MNPNEYDDAAFLEASNEFQSSPQLEALWEAGASAEDIISELNNYFAEMGITNSSGNGPLEVRE